jgi:Spy/CpxP family protein refolding chaperone
MEGKGMEHPQDHPGYWLPEDLQLTPEQIEKMESIQRTYLADIIPLRNDLFNKKYALRRLFSDPAASAEVIRAKQEEVFAVQRQIQEKLLDYRLRVRDILTPQQFQLWISRFELRPGPMMRRGHGME